MFALVDANSFYASAEEVFDPSIRGKPIVVLTNNDGCICAMSSAAKQLGIKSFSPYFQARDVIEKSGTIVRSSNYELYDDLSRKVFNVTGRFANQHIYSVDEAFLKFDLQPLDQHDWLDLAREIKRSVWLETRIPVGVGIAPTPTLAKAASHASKRLAGFDGIAVLDSKERINKVLAQMPCSDVWGVGKRIDLRLARMKIYSALDLANAPIKHIRKMFSVELEKTVRELNGEPCFNWKEQRDDKQQIFASRSFGTRVVDKEVLKHAIEHHAQRVGKKLRAQGSLASALKISAQSSPQKANFYKKAIIHQFAHPIDDDRQIVHAAMKAVDTIYCEGVEFAKCGIGAISIVSKQNLQEDMFAPSSSALENKRDKKDGAALMACMDKINAKFGKRSLALARQCKDDKDWAMKRDYLSPHYTTKWQDLPKFRC